MLNGMYNGYKRNNQKADYNFKKAIESAIKYDEKEDLSYAHQEYAEFLSKNGNYKEAYKNLNKYNQLKEEINLEDKAIKAKVAGINLDIDEYKREIDRIGILNKTRKNYFILKSSVIKRC